MPVIQVVMGACGRYAKFLAPVLQTVKFHAVVIIPKEDC